MPKRRKDLNNKYIDENNVLHIFINRDNKTYEALYSGKHIEDVMDVNWNIRLRRNGEIENVLSGTYSGKHTLLHRVDFEDNVPSHICINHTNNDPLDNRIENLRIVSKAEINKNRKSKNDLLTGIRKSGGGWYSVFQLDNNTICTKTKHDLKEARLDNLITQRHLGCKHNEELFYLLDDLSEERIKEVTDLLDEKIKRNKNKILDIKEYKHDIEEKDGYYILHKNGKEMLFDCELEFIKDKNIYLNNKYWMSSSVHNNEREINLFHRELLMLKPNDYEEYNIHVDHLNINENDNRMSNLIITTLCSNQSNKQCKGYTKTQHGYQVTCLKKYKFWDFIGGVRQPSFKTEQEAINEVNRRKEIVENTRVKLKSKEELDALIRYCLDNNYILENGLADLDLGYLYWKNILNIAS